MIDITKAQANQTTTNGVNGDWSVTLDGDELYKLPEYFSVQDTFLVRYVIEKMMALASEDTRNQEQQLAMVKMERVVSKGNTQLNLLKQENERLADVLENLIGE